MQDREGRRLGDRRKKPDRRKVSRRKVARDDQDRRTDERRGKFGKHMQAPHSPEHKKVGDETKNPLPDKDLSQEQPGDGGNELRAGDGDPGER